jgi:ABC-type phosphate transport system ATPase subunit
MRDGALIDCNIDELCYGKFEAVRNIAVKPKKLTITAFIRPSGSGKSTVLRCLNRMNDQVRGLCLALAENVTILPAAFSSSFCSLRGDPLR